MKLMTEPQLKQAIAHLLTTVNVGAVDGDRAQVAIKDIQFTRRFEEWLSDYQVHVAPDSIAIAEAKLIEMLGTVPTSATTLPFVAKDRFKLKKDGGICSYFGDNFKAWFMKGVGKTEAPFAGSTLRYGTLRRNATDMPQNPGGEAIIPTLGGEEKSETTLTEMFFLMEAQADGKEGILLTNGWANIFYVRDSAGVLRTVRVFWGGVGWGVDAYSVGGPYVWNDGHRVFSRNSDLKSLEPSAPGEVPSAPVA